MKSKLLGWAKRAALFCLVAIIAMGAAYTLPADIALVFAVDMAAYVEVVVTVFVVSQVARIRPTLLAARLWLASLGSRLRGRTSIRRPSDRKTPSGANDDDPASALALAA